ncbi:hypothetical protein COCON_G00032900 [Conger conger]|uniref:Uncharacterized protein n=1 Tax=Conger conger TaxID=82655 RepID=A0A9Q1DZ04_CONCO|nr:hypothetical protein COCON_G00032900 [Conger conger]
MGKKVAKRYKIKAFVKVYNYLMPTRFRLLWLLENVTKPDSSLSYPETKLKGFDVHCASLKCDLFDSKKRLEEANP